MNLSHIIWNITGLSLPLVVAAVSVPHLIDRLGTERFGLLALAWGLIGYAGALDLGIGRALTQLASRLQGGEERSSIPNALATAERITLFAGLLGALLIIISAILGVANLVNTEFVPEAEITNAVLVLAIALPAQAMSATYKGLNEAFLNFKGVNLLRIGLGVLNFGAPLVMSQFTTELPWLVATLMISRLLSLGIYRYLAYSCLQSAGIVSETSKYSAVFARSLFFYGAWITASSVLSPLMTHADRFLIAYIVSATAVTTYVLPYEVVTQNLILVGAVTTVIFPILAKLTLENTNSWKFYFHKWLFIVVGVMAFVCLAISLLLPLILNLWLKKDYQHDSALVGQVLCLGVFANSIGSMYYALLHARGRPDLTAKLHIIELPLYISALFILLDLYGVYGAAWAWSGRMIVDSIMLFRLANR